VLTIFAALFPVFGFVMLGAAAERTAWLGPRADQALSQLVAQIALPVLTFRSMATMAAADLVVPAMIAAMVIAPLVVWLLVFLIERFRGEGTPMANIVAMAACFGNGAFVGLPVCLAVVGPKAAAPATVAMALYTLVVFSWCLFMSLAGREDGNRLRDAARAVALSLARNPLVIGCFCGIAVAVMHVPLPTPLNTLVAGIAGITGPCALLAIGMVLAQRHDAPPRMGLGVALAGKLLILPLATWGVLRCFAPLPLAWQATAIIMAGASTATSTFVVGAQAGAGPMRMGAATVAYSTIGAALSLPLLLLALNVAGVLPSSVTD